MNRKFVNFIPAIVWGILLFSLSLMPGGALPDFSLWSIFQVDKIGHLLAYAGLVFWMLFGFYRNKRPKPIEQKTLVFVLIFAICYGIVIEFLQISISTGRYFEFLDIIANIIGSFIGLISLKMFNKNK